MRRIALLSAAALLTLTLAACAPAQTAEFIGLDAAKAAALEAAGLSGSQVEFTTTGLDQKNGIDFYAVDFTSGGQSYTYDIDAVTGVVIDDGGASAAAGQAAAPQTSAPADSLVTDADSFSSAAPQSSAPQSSAPAQSGGIITEQQAKEYALAHAGLESGQVTFLRCKLDWEDGRQVYEVEFFDGDYTEYDYEIAADDGTVVKYDYDAEYAVPQNTAGQSLTADEAKALALAQVPGAGTGDIVDFEADYDDGRIQYEGEIRYDGMKYEFEIDGYSGAIREWEAEPTRR